MNKKDEEMPENHPELFEQLNPPQVEAVRHRDGPILILAGAGSGKTRVLTRRVANLVLNHRVHPAQILAVTFTNKATEEMRERLRILLGEQSTRLWVSTFHAAGLRILRQHAHLLGYSNSFVVYDEQDTRGVLKGIISELGLNEKKFPPALFSRIIDDAKNSFISPEEYSKLQKEDISATIYDRYQKALLKANAMDFGDLLCNTQLLFTQHPEVLAKYQRNLRYVLVDEYQDTNVVQYQIIANLVKEHRNILVVGDDDQSIYSFRGATLRNILDFEKDFPGAKIIKLEQNYRSTANILDSAHAVIERNKSRKDKKLWTEQPRGDSLVTYLGNDEFEEAEFIAQEISEALSHGVGLNDIALFYRTNAQSRALEEALLNSGLPYRIYGGLKFYERKEIKDILSYLRLLANEADDQAFLRVINTPPRGIGPQTVKSVIALARDSKRPLLEAAKELAARSNPLRAFITLLQKLSELARSVGLAELVAKILELTEYEATLKVSKDAASTSRLENLHELLAIAAARDEQELSHLENLQKFLDRVALTAGSDEPVEANADPQSAVPAGFITLMTLHLAKGLEFPVVFLTGMEEGLLPHYRSLNDPTAIEEERRLCYVGMTRAKRRLYLTRAFSRGMFAAGDGFGFGGTFRDASRFAFDIPEQYLEQRGHDFLLGGKPAGVEVFEADPTFEEVEAPEKPPIIKRSKSKTIAVLPADQLKKLH
ncbi:MAG: UvrD-helicase domain-containing protein [Oligoflexia bacterium]|nr:UvrD-helicase domain-containing protein [Oligoflexia bacterium]